MKTRCNNPKSPSYFRYGGRGIKVCERWNDFSLFLLDMGDPPPGKSLDRKKNHLGYSPDNCRWATGSEQANNTRRNVMIEWNGKRQSLTQWSRELGINYETLKRRRKNGWSVEKMFTAPIRSY